MIDDLVRGVTRATVIIGACMTAPALLLCSCGDATRELQQAVQDLRSADETTRRAGMKYFIAQGPSASDALPELLAMVPELKLQIELYPAIAAVLGDRQVEQGEWAELMESLRSTTAQDRWAAAWQLGYLGSPSDPGASEETRRALEESLDDPDPRVCRMALWALMAVSRGSDAIRDVLRVEFATSDIRWPPSLSGSVKQELLRRASDPDPGVRFIALQNLLESPLTDAVHDLFLDAVTDDDAEVRSLAVLGIYLSLRQVPPSDTDLAVASLIPQLQHPQHGTRLLAALALALLGSDASPAIPGLINLLSDTHPAVRSAAAYCVGSVGADAGRAEAALIPLLDDSDPSVRSAAIGALGRIGSQARIPEILRLLEEDATEEVAVACLQALGELGQADQRAVSALMERLRPDSPSAALVATALSLARLLDADTLRKVAAPNLVGLMDEDPEIAAAVACLAARVAVAQGNTDLGEHALETLRVELELSPYGFLNLLSEVVSSVGHLTALDGLQQGMSSAAPLLEKILTDDSMLPDYMLPTSKKALRESTLEALDQVREYLRRDR